VTEVLDRISVPIQLFQWLSERYWNTTL